MLVCPVISISRTGPQEAYEHHTECLSSDVSNKDLDICENWLYVSLRYTVTVEAKQSQKRKTVPAG